MDEVVEAVEVLVVAAAKYLCKVPGYILHRLPQMVSDVVLELKAPLVGRVGGHAAREE